MLNLGLPIREFDTLNGFLIAQIDYIPKSNERPVIRYNHAEFKVSKMDENRIETIIISIQE